MSTPHLLNLAIHIGAGLVGIWLGFGLLVRPKGTAAHRKAGIKFVFALAAVTASALTGLVAFRFMPLFAVLTLLVGYLAVAGWRTARTREAGPAAFDLAWAVAAVAGALILVPILSRSDHTGNSRPVVVWSSLGALVVVVAYDLLKWTFPRQWFRRLWLPEHIYKMVSALFGMISAFVGNVVPWGQPWSQTLPSATGVCVIAYFIAREARHPLRRTGQGTT